VRRWMRLLAAVGLVALLVRLVGRAVLAGRRWHRLGRLRPSSAPAIPQAVPEGLWASDPTLVAPAVSAGATMDNAVILEWQDTNPTTEEFVVFVGEHGAAPAPEAFVLRFPNSRRRGWFTETLQQGPFQPGATFDIDIRAATSSGISPQGQVAVATTSSPMIRIGDPAAGFPSLPAATRAFAMWDVNGNGVVDDAPGSGGAYPLFPSSSGAQPVALAGNRYDRIQGGPRANVIVGYFFVEQGEPRFVAYHLFIDPVTSRQTPVSVSYGDSRPGDLGTRVWVSTGAQQSVVQVTEGTAGDPAGDSPNVVEGFVTAPTLASDNTIRIVQFTFRQALLLE
jgi:hypothetical protein